MAKSKNNKDCGCTIFIARLFIGIFFLLAFIGKAVDSSGTMAYMESAGFPVVEFFYLGALLILLVSSVGLIIGYKIKYSSWLLVLYVTIATLMFHIGEGQMTSFLKNLAIIGGLLALISTKSGKFAIDKD